MYKFAIIDDNQEDRKRIYNAIYEYCQYHKIQFQYKLYSSAEDFDITQQFDAIFLDIDMPKKKGTTLAREIHKNMTTKIIFVTNHDQYIHSTFDAGAFHFIHKKNLNIEFIHVLNILFQKLNSSLVSLKTKRGEKKVMIKDIIYINTHDKLTTIYTYDQQYDIWESLSSLYNRLKEHDFEKINQSTLVNLKYIENYNHKTVTLKDSTILPLSTRLRNIFINSYSNYILKN